MVKIGTLKTEIECMEQGLPLPEPGRLRLDIVHEPRKRNPDAIWRKGATDQEIADVEIIDAMIDNLEERRSRLTRRRYLITNRACKRAGQAAPHD